MLSDCITIILTPCLLCAGVWCYCDVTAWWWLVMARLRRIVFRYYHPPTIWCARPIFNFPNTKNNFSPDIFIHQAEDATSTISIRCSRNIEWDKYTFWPSIKIFIMKDSSLQYGNVAMFSEILEIWHIDIDHGVLETSSHICTAPPSLCPCFNFNYSFY